MFAVLTAAERAEVLDSLMREHPELAVEAEHLASELLSSVSAGRGYVDETEAARELVEQAIEPFRSDTERRAGFGHADAATSLAIGIVAGLYLVREPETGTVLAQAGEEATNEIADNVLQLAERLGIDVPDDAASTYLPRWLDLR